MSLVSPHTQVHLARRVQAFTLIELLVVISIISLLISILLPALSRAREVAAMAKCGSNVRQFGMAVQMYIQDSRDWLPIYATPNWYSTDNQFRSYLRDVQQDWKKPNTIGDCPTNRSGFNQSGGYFLDYAYDRHMSGRRMLQFTKPSNAVSFMDASYYFVGINNPGQWWLAQSVQFIHNKAANFVHLDGHVKNYVFENVTDAKFLP